MSIASEELLLAVRRRESDECLQYYIDSEGARPNYCDPRGVTALMEAAVNLDVRIMTFLVERGAMINLKDGQNKTALHYVYANNTTATEANFFSPIAFLLSKGADPNEDYDERDSLLNWAAKKGYARILSHILEVHDYSREQDKVWLALSIAEEEGQDYTIRLLNNELDRFIESSSVTQQESAITELSLQ